DRREGAGRDACAAGPPRQRTRPRRNDRVRPGAACARARPRGRARDRQRAQAVRAAAQRARRAEGAAPGAHRSLEEEVRAHVALQQAKAEEIELIQRELEGVRTLWHKNLVQLTRLTALEREAVRLKGERAQSFSAAAQARGRITETELQIIQIDQDLMSEV